jgi:hypothetical protein
MLDASELIRAGRLEVFRSHCNMFDHERTLMSQGAIKSGFTHVFFHDADMSFELSHIRKLLEAGKDIITGTYFFRGIVTGRSPQPMPFACVVQRDGKYITRAEIRKAREKKELIEVDAVGCGCLLVTTDALKRIDNPQFKLEWEVRNDVSMRRGEDQWFSERAKRCGLKMFLHPDVLPDHYAVCLSGETLRDENGVEIPTTLF